MRSKGTDSFMATEKEVDDALVQKAACRVVLAKAINSMLEPWQELPEEEQEKMQEALIMTLADLTAEITVAAKEVSRQHFLDFMGHSYDMATTKRDAVDSGAVV